MKIDEERAKSLKDCAAVAKERASVQSIKQDLEVSSISKDLELKLSKFVNNFECGVLENESRITSSIRRSDRGKI